MTDTGRRCRDCGPGYRIGDDGCRHGPYEPAPGETGICRTCVQPIWWEAGTIRHRERVGWSDRIERGGDSIVCFKAVGYRHVPMGGREAAIYQAGFKAGQESQTDVAGPDVARPHRQVVDGCTCTAIRICPVHVLPPPKAEGDV